MNIKSSPYKTGQIAFLILLVGALIHPAVRSAQSASHIPSVAPADGPKYPNSQYTAILALGKELYKGLKPPQRAMVNKIPVFLDTDLVPTIKLVEYPDQPQPMRGVFISAGFCDLVNYIAHARAIDKLDRKQKGYFERYILSLSAEIGDKELKPPEGLMDPKNWTEPMLNEELSNFNQIVGVTLGTKMAHHYLGHYKKYADKVSDEIDNPLPINVVLTLDEWEAAHAAGVKNALNCGFGIDGVKAFYEAIDKMPKRPAWVIHFFPLGAKYSKVKKDMEALEKQFFSGTAF